MDKIQKKRIYLWEHYYNELLPLEQQGKITLPTIPDNTTVNGQLFYILCRNPEERTDLLNFLRTKEIISVFHYLPLHLSPYYKEKYKEMVERTKIKLTEDVKYFD